MRQQETHQEMRHRVRDEPLGSSHESESVYTMAARIGREQARLEIAGWESANELEDETGPDTPNKPCPEPLCVSGHPPDVYCDLCCPNIPSSHQDTRQYEEQLGPELGARLDPRGTERLNLHQAEQHIKDLLSGAVQPESIHGHPQRLAPEDEVGTFDIGKSQDILKDEDKGPGFEARLKNIEGKAPMSLLSPIFIEGICAALSHGTGKYAANMWRDDPMTFTAELDSIFRHLFAFLRCEDYDAAPPSGSGLLHLFNAGCRLMFLTERYFTHPELDDRYPAPGLNDAHLWGQEEEGAEAQYSEADIDHIDEQLDEMGRSELYDLVHSLSFHIDSISPQGESPEEDRYTARGGY